MLKIRKQHSVLRKKNGVILINNITNQLVSKNIVIVLISHIIETYSNTIFDIPH